MLEIYSGIHDFMRKCDFSYQKLVLRSGLGLTLTTCLRKAPRYDHELTSVHHQNRLPMIMAYATYKPSAYVIKNILTYKSTQMSLY